MTALLPSAGVARISADGQYRYTLSRRWGDGVRPLRVLWVMLNPSTADATTDDATIRRCLAFSQRWAFDELTVVNLYAWRATNPIALPLDPAVAVGDENDGAIATAAFNADVLVAAWGAAGGEVNHRRRRRTVTGLLLCTGKPLHHLGLTACGEPRHPLYVAGDTVPQPWESPW